MECLSFADFVQRTGRSLKSVVMQSMTPGARVPTLCTHGCQIEVHERCRHGCSPIVIELMLAGYKWNEVLSQNDERSQPSAQDREDNRDSISRPDKTVKQQNHSQGE
jgi:hypothetical protein